MIPLLLLLDHLRALTLAKKIIFIRVNSNYSRLEALCPAQSFIKLEMASSARKSTLDELLESTTRVHLVTSVVEILAR